MNPTDAVKSSEIKCDSCDWKKRVEWEEVPKWHNAECPSCGKSPIVSDDDLQTWQMLNGLLYLQAGLYPDGLDEKKTANVRVDTAPMRK